MPVTYPSWLIPCDVRDIVAPNHGHPSPQGGRVKRVARLDSQQRVAPFNPIEEYLIGAILHCGPWTPQFFNYLQDESISIQLMRLYDLTSEGRAWWEGNLLVGLEIHRFSGEANQAFLSSLTQAHIPSMVMELISPLSSWFPPPYSAHRVSDEVLPQLMNHDLTTICDFLEKTQHKTVTLRVGRWNLPTSENPPEAIRMLRSRYRVVGILTHPSTGVPLNVNAFND